MLNKLELINVGPAASMSLTFGSHLNILTGNNGLGKSFLLDVAWWSMTRMWPSETNPRLSGHLPALPRNPKQKATIQFEIQGKSPTPTAWGSTFRRQTQTWSAKTGRPINPGLVIYALADGSFAVWDPARNYWKQRNGEDIPNRPDAFVFTTNEIWNGLKQNEQFLCNGLLADWAIWQKENGEDFKLLCAILNSLSTEEEPIRPGELRRMSIFDSRDIPTLDTAYGSVFVLHASSGLKRILALAYLLTWTWKEHLIACKLRGKKPTHQITFLFDEIEAHLHPKWQRSIVSSLLNLMENLKAKTRVQLIAATHSPLVLSSLEPFFDKERDCWFDIDLVNGKDVVLTKRDYLKHGDASAWLESNAFDLQYAGSKELEDVLKELEKDTRTGRLTQERINYYRTQFNKLLDESSPLWNRWYLLTEGKDCDDSSASGRRAGDI